MQKVVRTYYGPGTTTERLQILLQEGYKVVHVTLLKDGDTVEYIVEKNEKCGE